MRPAEWPRPPRILIVDDEPANLALLERLLRREGYSEIAQLADPEQTSATHLAFRPDLVVLDLMMPGIDGYALLDSLHRLTPADDFLPILVLTADTTLEAKRRALALGARDFVTKPFDLLELALRIQNLLEIRLMFRRAVFGSSEI